MSLSSSSQLLPSSQWHSLPTSPGIYIYKNDHQDIIYVGKAKHLKKRVSSYFVSPTKLGPKTKNLVSQIKSIEYIEVQSEIEALLLESKLIKKFKPYYNLISKDDKSPYFIHFTTEPLPKPVINHLEKKAVAGPFLSGYIAKQILKQFRHITPYCTAKRPVTKPCFYSHLGLCNPCPGSPNFNNEQYRKNISHLRRLLTGQFSSVNKELHQKMNSFSKNELYELANNVKKQISALEHLINTPVAPDNYIENPNLVSDLQNDALQKLSSALNPYIAIFINSLPTRIEMYDNAHLQGQNATAAMTVALNGKIAPPLYRHFTIRKAKSNSDVDMMEEVLSRRLKRTDWPKPDLIVLDGGKPQLSAIKNLPLICPVIALAKQFETIYIPKDNDYIELTLPKDNRGLLLLERLRDEAHRFSRRLHHKHQSQSLLHR